MPRGSTAEAAATSISLLSIVMRAKPIKRMSNGQHYARDRAAVKNSAVRTKTVRCAVDRTRLSAYNAPQHVRDTEPGDIATGVFCMMTKPALVSRRIVIVILIFLLLAGGCAGRDPQAVSVQDQPTSMATRSATITATPTPSATPTSTPTRTPTSTFTPTSTSTPTPIPTPTALPVTVHDDLGQMAASMPVAQSGAPCGVVDQLDFPLDPPEGNRAVGGGFGAFRNRYDMYHAGEDWGMASRQNLGAPVYSIGHGRVTYAQPLGWGADQGVVILEHIFSDDSTILSFYGHLDPPSVVLEAGACVSRGDRVGAIGRPRTPPHLHFEIRSHMAYEPGPGYWSIDPTQAGWEPPSQYIWNNRMASGSRALWMWSSPVGFSKGLGMLDGDTFVVINDGDLVGINAQDGESRWRQQVVGELSDGLIDARQGMIYVVTEEGKLQGYSLSAEQRGIGSAVSGVAAISLVWSIDLESTTAALLMPLPQSGVVVSFWERIVAVSAQGELLWETDLPTSPSDWAMGPGGLLLATRGLRAEVWSVGAAGPEAWGAQAGGRLAIGPEDEGAYLFDRQTIYHLDLQTRSAELLHTLPRGFPGLGDLLALPDGSVLAVHAGGGDKRLIALQSDGSLRWQRSYAAAIPGTPRLLLLGGQPYALFQQGSISLNRVALYAIDPSSSELTRIFAGGTENYGTDAVSAFALDEESIVIGIRGAGVLALDTGLAGGAGDTDSQDHGRP